MTKTELYNKVTNEMSELLKGIKLSATNKEAIMTILETNLKPKHSGGTMKHPPVLDEDGNIVEAYCKFYDTYMPVEEMVISNGKSKGYSKKSLSRWNKARRLADKLRDKFIALDDPTSEEGKEIKATIQQLEDWKNKSEYYISGEIDELLKSIEASFKA